MRGPAVRAVALAAGGTGGHVFPAEALAAELRRRGHRVVLITDARSAARGLFGADEVYVISGAGLARRGVRRGARALAGLARGIVQARAILGGTEFGALVAFGGYPAVAPVLAARSRRRRPFILLHEQNAVLGRANRALARLADLVALGVADTARLPAGIATRVTGNPLRPTIEAAAARAYAPPEGPVRLLVLGGSLGARVFSDVVPDAVAALPEALRARLQVTQQCRAEDLPRVRAAYDALGIAASLAPFFTDIAAHLAAAHLLLARAGAATCAEAAALALPAILVPLPGAIDDHQSANAAALARAGGALILPQPACTPAALADALGALLRDPGRLARMSAAAAGAAIRDAAAALADLVEQNMAAVP